ncbi:hypothetical protein LEP1GSC137_1220 [Leptospira borgpetersenii str. Noumea 25]|nr:hypothetical protein LEP1GSC137_1220 [Leptospira borgpetersenii str. Noumea 25]
MANSIHAEILKKMKIRFEFSGMPRKKPARSSLLALHL